MRALKTLLALALAAALLAVPALALDLEPGTGSGFYVRDTADVLSAETEEIVAQYNAVLESECDSAQLVFVTVNYLDEDTDVASARLMSDWGVGSRTDSNGMLVLLVAEEGRGWLTVGSGIHRSFDDDTAGDYMDDYFWPSADKSRYDDAVQTLAEKLYDWYLDYYDVDAAALDSGYGYDESYGGYGYDGYGYGYGEPEPAQSTGGGFFMAIFAIILIVFMIWIIGASSRFRRMRGWGYTGGFWPIFWFGGRRRYNDWYRRQPPPPPPPMGGRPMGPGPGPGPMNMGMRNMPSHRRPAPPSRPSRPSGGFRSGGGGFRGGGGGFHGGGFGGHSSGGGGGRR